MSTFSATELLDHGIGVVAVSDGVNIMGVNSDGSINVRVISGGGGGGSNPAAGPTGSAVPADADYNGVSIGGTLQGSTGFSVGSQIAMSVAIVDGSGNQIVTFGGGTQFADNANSGGAPTGTLAMGWDSANSKIRALKVDASQNLEVVINAALPAGTNVIGHVIVDSFGSAVDVTDRAARLVGVVYGSQGQKLLQTPTNFNLQVELATGATLYDARQIRALTAADVVTVDQGTSPWVVSGSVSITGTPTVNIDASSTPLTVYFDGSPAVASLNVHLTNALPLLVQDSSAVGLDSVVSPTTFLLVGGKTNDSPAEYDAVPLGPEGRSVIIEGFAGASPVPISGSISVSNFPTTQNVAVVSALPAGTNLIGTVNIDASSTPLTVSFDGSPAVASLNVHLTNALPLLVQDSSAVGLDSVVSPTTFLLVGGKTNDSPAEYDAVPLGPEGRSVIVEGFVGAAPVSVNWTAAQHVIVDSGGGGGIQYADLTQSGSAPTGTLAMGWDAQSLKIRALQVAPNTGILEVDIEASNTPLTVSFDGSPVVASLNVHLTNSPSVSFVAPQHVIVDSGGGGGIQFADGAVSGASPTGTLAMAWDSTNLKVLANHADPVGSLFVNNAGRKATYSAAIAFNPTGGSPLSPMDIATIFGSATKTIRVTRIEVSLMTTGVAAVDEVLLSVRSTPNTKGVGTAMPSVAHDNLDANATATVIYWTQPPSQGVHVAYARGAFFNDQSSALPGAATWLWTFGDGRGGAKEFVFRDANHGFAIVVGAVSTQYAIVSFEWTEE